MEAPERPTALTIAGFDPSAGAGILADIKTFELFRVYGIAVMTGNTIQNDSKLKKIHWVDQEVKEEGIAVLSERMKIKAVKLGMHRNLEDVLHSINCIIKYFPDAYIIWDPIIGSTSGFKLEWTLSPLILQKILAATDLITPNVPEFHWLFQQEDPQSIIDKQWCKAAFLLKGGHSGEKLSIDRLYRKDLKTVEFSAERLNSSKHGSGCVLSAGIAAGISKGFSLEESIWHSKDYITGFFKSNNTILGYHYN